MPLHDFVHKDSCNKFSRCHKYRTPEHLSPKRLLPSSPDSLLGKKQQTEAAKHKHRPMGKPAERHFYPIINTAPQRPQKQILTYPFHGKNVLLYQFRCFQIPVEHLTYSLDVFLEIICNIALSFHNSLSDIIESAAFCKPYRDNRSNQRIISREMHQKIVSHSSGYKRFVMVIS